MFGNPLLGLGIAGAVLLAFLGAAGFSYERGRSSAQAECNAAAIQSKLDVANDDLAQARRSIANAEARLAAREAKFRENMETVDDLERDLAAAEAARNAEPVVDVEPVAGKCPVQMPNGADRIDADGVRRLRGSSKKG